MANESQNVPPTGHYHVWQLRHLQARGLAQHYWDCSNILRESHVCLDEAKSQSLTCNLVCEALQVGKSWDNIQDIFNLKHSNTNIRTYTSHFMEIQQKENETPAVYIHHFKMEAERCDFNNDNAAIIIFIESLRDAHNIAEKVYEKDPQTLCEVIKLVEKLNTAQQVTATLSLLIVDMMTTVLSVARRVILVTTALRHNATAVMILVILPKTAPRKLPHQGHPFIIIDLAPNHIIATAEGTGHTPPTTDAAKETTLTGQDYAIDPSMTKVPVTTEGTHPTLYLVTTAILITPLQTGTPEDIPTGIPHTTTGTTCQDTLQALPIDCTQ